MEKPTTLTPHLLQLKIEKQNQANQANLPVANAKPAARPLRLSVEDGFLARATFCLLLFLTPETGSHMPYIRNASYQILLGDRDSYKTPPRKEYDDSVAISAVQGLIQSRGFFYSRKARLFAPDEYSKRSRFSYV